MFNHPKRTMKGIALLSIIGLSVSACSSETDDGGGADDATATIVVTTTQIGSVVSQITECAGGQTQVLMSPGDDPHQFEASSAQIVDMINADLVVTNGLGLEASMQRSLDNAVTDGAHVIELAPQLDPLPLGDDHQHEPQEHADHDHNHEHGNDDPHVWMDVSRMATGAQLIGDKVAQRTGDDTYADCGAEVADELHAVDAQIENLLADVVSARLVTDHAAYGYFADRYGVTIEGVVIPGGSTDGEPSSQDLVQLTQLLNDQGADALVTSIANKNRMVQALAEETGNEIPVVELYEAGVGEPGSETETYQQAMLYNAKALAEAMN